MAATEMKHITDALAKARAVYASKIFDADTVLENWQNEGARMIRQTAETVAALEGSLETFDALEQERRAAQTRQELHSAVQAHEHAVDRARIIVKRAVLEHAQAYVAAGVAMSNALAESFAA